MENLISCKFEPMKFPHGFTAMFIETARTDCFDLVSIREEFVPQFTSRTKLY